MKNGDRTNPETLIERIYEASVFPELWTEVLDTLAELSTMKGGLLFTVDPSQKIRWRASEPLTSFMTTLVRDGWMAKNSRAERVSRLDFPRFVGDLDIFTRPEMDRDPFYTELLRPYGLGWGAGTLIPLPTGDTLVFTVEGSGGPIDRSKLDTLNVLRPHLARAGLLAERLQLERARSLVGLLEQIRLPAAVIDRDARVVASNRLLEGLEDQVTIGARDRLRFIDQSAHSLFMRALIDLTSDNGVKDIVNSFPAPPTVKSSHLVAHLLPIKGAAHDIFVGALGILILTPLTSRDSLPTALLQARLDPSGGEGSGFSRLRSRFERNNA